MKNQATRQEVYHAIDTERIYQIEATEDVTRPDMVEPFGIGQGLLAIDAIVEQAKQIWYKDYPPYKKTMNHLRKVAGVCVKMGEQFGMPERK